jgi:hypothetical protein
MEEGTLLPPLRPERAPLAPAAASPGWKSRLDRNFGLDVKAANDNALELVVPRTPNGTWSTSDIRNNGGQQPGEGHMDFFGVSRAGTGPPDLPSDVTEPNSLTLIGVALVSRALVSRRRQSG